MRRNNIWQVRELTSEYQDNVRILSDSMNISRITAELLVKRGCCTPEQADFFINADFRHLSDPLLIPGMEPAVLRIKQALDNHEMVMIYGDYDADGVCSVAILLECLRSLGGLVDYCLPSRFQEGYGLHEDAVRSAAADGINLLITVDCGITSVSEIKLAGELGLEVIITDHHEPGNVLPEARYIVNPKLAANGLCNELAGAGVVFQLTRALSAMFTLLQPEQWLDIAALATVADLVPLTGDNRIIVKEGLARMQLSQRLGIKSLTDAVGLSGKRLTSYHLGYVLGPRLNAVGRMGEADAALELLLASEQRSAMELAEKLNQINKQRQDTEAMILQEALSEAEICAARDDQAIVIGREGWHQGVIGIIASRLVDKYKRPTIVVSWDREKGRGSGRSIQEVDLHQALSQCSRYLEKFGGHQQAAGISLTRDNFEGFQAALSNAVASSGVATGVSSINADIVCSLPELSIDLVRELYRMEPFGSTNPVPRFLIRRVRAGRVTSIGKNGEHVKFSVEDGSKRAEAIGFGWGKAFDETETDNCLLDLIFEAEINEFNGAQSLQLKIIDIKSSIQPDKQTQKKNINIETDNLFNEIEELMRQKLSKGPVLIVYPSVRCLEKHLVGLSSSFPAHCLDVIHGRLPKAAQKASLESLFLRKRKVFLTTACFFKYYIISRLSNEDEYGIALWPEDWLKEMLPDHWVCLSWPYEVPQVAAISRDDLITEVGRERRIFYTNRRNTLRTTMLLLDCLVEADVNDIDLRRQVRQSFLDKQYSDLFIDGACGGGLLAIAADRLVLLDLPFGEYEIFNCLAQSGKSINTINMCVPPDAKTFNQLFLDAYCPDDKLINDLYDHVRSGRVEMPPEGPRSKLKSANPMLARLQTKSCLEILKDVELCDYIVRPNGFEVWSTGHSSESINYENSIYLQEGLCEKSLFNEIINRLLEGGSSGY